MHYAGTMITTAILMLERCTLHHDSWFAPTEPVFVAAPFSAGAKRIFL